MIKTASATGLPGFKALYPNVVSVKIGPYAIIDFPVFRA